MLMRYEWDNNKNISNIAKHGVDFETINNFNWESAIINQQIKKDELRYIALGLITDRLHGVIYTNRNSRIRIISMRKANKREIKYYENNK